MPFDPYYRWLGISPEDQPADHYRLLSVPRFTPDLDVIENAVDRQMAHVRTFQGGKHSEASQRLLNELAAARVCLLNEQSKAAYDAQLTEALAAESPSASASSGRASEDTRNCPQCQAALAVEHVFCISCGYDFRTQKQVVTEYGNSVDDGWTRRTFAGRRLTVVKSRASGNVPAVASKRKSSSPLAGIVNLVGIVLGGAGGIALILFVLKMGLGLDPLGLWAPDPVAVLDRPAVPVEVPPAGLYESERANAPQTKSLPTKRITKRREKAAEKKEVPSSSAASRPPDSVLPPDQVASAAGNAKPDSRPDTVASTPSREPAKPAPGSNAAEKKTMAKESAPAPAVAPFAEVVAKRHQEQWAKHLDRPIEMTNSIGMKLTLIPPGEFLMGSPETEALRLDNETQHRVKLTQPYFMGTHEVTQVQYARVMGENPSKFQSAMNPVENVSWNDTVEFCRKLSALPAEKAASRVYRLPTEAEWEYACRAGTTTAYSFFGNPGRLPSYGWFKGNARRTTHPIGQRKSNVFGLYDLHGNVWEWCSDWYGDYPNQSLTDPVGPASGPNHVCRGGSWYFGAELCRSAYRRQGFSSQRDSTGFRVALAVNLEPDSQPATVASTPSRELAAPESGSGAAEKKTAEEKTTTPAPALAPFSAAVAKDHQSNWARHLRQRVVVTNSIGMKLTLIPPGEFVMGSPETEPGRTDSEAQHQVTLTKPFFMGSHEVTQQQYFRVMGTNPSRIKSAMNPVETVSWNDAVEFCRRLSTGAKERAAGLVYRLPTEAEWEYACRAGTTTAYSFGDQPRGLFSHGWFSGNTNAPSTSPVGKGRPNAFGLYDMHGNVDEWCSDRYGDYPSGSVTDPAGPSLGSARILRGGCWYSDAEDCRSAVRYGISPSDRNSKRFAIGKLSILARGFRVALSPSGQ